MEKYAPNKMELASRDVVSRAEQTEINEGRGFPDGTVALDITVVPKKRIHEALREIVLVGRDFAGVDITREPSGQPSTVEMMIAGDPERRSRARRLADGIPVDINTWQEIRDLDKSNAAVILPVSARNLKMVQQGIWAAVNGDRGTATFHPNPFDASGTVTVHIIGPGGRGGPLTIWVEQVMTDTALLADVVLPATTFLENYDFAKSYGTISMELVRPVIEPVGESHELVIKAPKKLAKFIARERPTTTCAVPTIWADLLRYSEDHEVDFSSVQRIMCGGAAVPCRTWARNRRRRPGPAPSSACGPP